PRRREPAAQVAALPRRDGAAQGALGKGATRRRGLQPESHPRREQRVARLAAARQAAVGRARAIIESSIRSTRAAAAATAPARLVSGKRNPARAASVDGSKS